jgi:hypothetical protein
MEVRDVFEENFRMPESDVIEQHQVLANLAHISYMRNPRHTVLAGQKVHGKKFAYTAQAGAIGLKVHYLTRTTVRIWNDELLART